MSLRIISHIVAYVALLAIPTGMASNDFTYEYSNHSPYWSVIEVEDIPTVYHSHGSRSTHPQAWEVNIFPLPYIYLPKITIENTTYRVLTGYSCIQFESGQWVKLPDTAVVLPSDSKHNAQETLNILNDSATVRMQISNGVELQDICITGKKTITTDHLHLYNLTVSKVKLHICNKTDETVMLFDNTISPPWEQIFWHTIRIGKECYQLHYIPNIYIPAKSSIIIHGTAWRDDFYKYMHKPNYQHLPKQTKDLSLPAHRDATVELNFRTAILGNRVWSQHWTPKTILTISRKLKICH